MLEPSSTTAHEPMATCIALATGGTAGHVTPALAVAEALRRRAPRARLLFLGDASGFEASLVAAAGHEFTPLPSAPWYGVGAGGRARAARQLLAGVRAARRVLRDAHATAVIGFGGYATAGAVLAARRLAIPTVLHEANARPGLSNRLLGRVATRICVAWPESMRFFAPAARVRHTGMPIRAAIAALAAAPHAPPPCGRLRLLVCGGSLGSPFLNAQVPALAAALRDAGIAVDVRHQAGGDAVDPIRAAYATRGITAQVERHVADMGAAYRWADAAVACAGAATLAELAAAGLPALLVPYAAASADHQADNAAAFAAATGARWLSEARWDLAAAVAALAPLAGDPAQWTAQSQRVRALARADAADAVARCIAECVA